MFYNDGEITEIYDRTVNEKKTEKQKLLLSDVQNYEKEAFASAARLIPDKYNIVSQRGEAKLDVYTGEKYYQVFTTISTVEGARSVIGYKHKI